VGDTAQLSVSGDLGSASIEWVPADEIISGQGTTTAFVAPTSQTTYGVNLSSDLGCSWSGTVTVNVSPLFGSTVTASADQTLVLPGTTVQLLATPATGVTYDWQPPGAVSDPTISNPTAVVQQTTTFIATISDGICIRSIPVTVQVYELLCEDPDIFVPNTFTPNGDGANDLLYVRGRHIARMEFKVFDRWGELVFESTDPSNGWDGRFKGMPVDPAVFVYHLRAWCIDGQDYFTKGNVTVVR
jgi:gliding motility-associated-like protein